MKRPPLQECAAHGPYRSWRPDCPSCRREQARLLAEQNDTGLRQERTDNREAKRPVPYGEFPPGFGEP